MTGRAVAYQQLWQRAEYGMSEEDFQTMLNAQHGRCAICGIREEEALGGRLRVDHDHVTGDIRGLLCMNCNTALGHFGDSSERLQQAIQYLNDRKGG